METSVPHRHGRSPLALANETSLDGLSPLAIADGLSPSRHCASRSIAMAQCGSRRSGAFTVSGAYVYSMCTLPALEPSPGSSPMCGWVPFLAMG
jgi:hypothetical protein